MAVWPYSCCKYAMATTLKLEAPWPEVKELLKEAAITLTDEDLVYSPGKEDELLNRLAKKMGRTEEQVKAWVESVSSNKGKAS
jgi:uncharacterized protein YjbJ (UPF0337 family)